MNATGRIKDDRIAIQIYTKITNRLKNTGTRIEAIKRAITFEGNVEMGLSLTFPILLLN